MAETIETAPVGRILTPRDHRHLAELAGRLKPHLGTPVPAGALERAARIYPYILEVSPEVLATNVTETAACLGVKTGNIPASRLASATAL